MLCRKFKQVPVKFTNNKPSHTLFESRHFSKKCVEFLSSVRFADNMSSTFRLRHYIKDLVVTRLLSGWRRSFLVSTVVKRCRRDRAVRDVIQCFKQAFFKPRRTFFLSVTAAYKARNDGPPSCSKDITDADLQALASEMDGVEELARATLYCKGCDQRVIFDKKLEGVLYCACKESPPPEKSFDGWVPYMEAEDVIIWRKEYKPGLFAYKVYGQYKEITAEDFAAIQVDGAYRRVWDSAVAALSVVERRANGVPDQTVLHWEVLWPRFFANRDYVYIRRHKQFDVKSKCLKHKEGIFNPNNTCKGTVHLLERPNVHSNAKRISIENELKEQQEDAMRETELKDPKDGIPKIALNDPKKATGDDKDSQVYVIVSRSCTHPKVPVTRSAIRVTNYWSHMVIKTLNGPKEVGTEFILTYYDEPTVGGLPTALTSFATGRAVPAFLSRMRKATNDYKTWRANNKQEAPDFIPFSPEKVSYEKPRFGEVISEEDMESSKLGPDLDGDKPEFHENGTSSRGTQTEQPSPVPVPVAYEKDTSLEDEKVEKPEPDTKCEEPPPKPSQPPSSPPPSSPPSSSPPPPSPSSPLSSSPPPPSPPISLPPPSSPDASSPSSSPMSSLPTPSSPPVSLPPPSSPLSFSPLPSSPVSSSLPTPSPHSSSPPLSSPLSSAPPPSSPVPSSLPPPSPPISSSPKSSPLSSSPPPPSPPPSSPPKKCAQESKDDTATEKERESAKHSVKTSPTPANQPHPENLKHRSTTKHVQKASSEVCATPEGDSNTPDGDSEKVEEGEKNNSWWRYLYPFYYFV